MADVSPIQVVLGFDFGLKRIGVAVGQVVTQSASPVCCVELVADRTGIYFAAGSARKFMGPDGEQCVA